MFRSRLGVRPPADADHPPSRPRRASFAAVKSKRANANALRRAAAAPAKPRAAATVVRAAADADDDRIASRRSPLERLANAGLALGAAAALTLGAPALPPATAAELEILQTPPPAANSGYIVDDAGLLSRAASGSIGKTLKDLEAQTGYHVNVVTVRKLVFEQDPFAFGDKVLETWYPTLEEGNNKGQILLVKNTKEGSVVGGPAFLKAVGNDVLDSILSKNIPYNLADEKYGEALTSSVDRIAAILEGKGDPGPPTRFEKSKEKTYKTKAEVRSISHWFPYDPVRVVNAVP